MSREVVDYTSGLELSLFVLETHIDSLYWNLEYA